MNSFFKPALKYFLILAMTLGMGYSVWLLPHDKREKKIKQEREKSITSPIDARDEAGRYLQQASEDFFYHEFDKAIENYGNAITAFEKINQLKICCQIMTL